MIGLAFAMRLSRRGADPGKTRSRSRVAAGESSDRPRTAATRSSRADAETWRQLLTRPSLEEVVVAGKVPVEVSLRRGRSSTTRWSDLHPHA